MIWLHLTSDQCCSSAFISSTKWICQNCLNLFLILFKTSLEFICNKLFDAVYKLPTIYCFNVDLLMLLMSLVNWIWCWVKLLRLRQWLRHNRSRIKMYSAVQTVHIYTTCVHNLTAFYCNTWSVCFHSINTYFKEHNESSFQPDTFKHQRWGQWIHVYNRSHPTSPGGAVVTTVYNQTGWILSQHTQQFWAFILLNKHTQHQLLNFYCFIF